MSHFSAKREAILLDIEKTWINLRDTINNLEESNIRRILLAILVDCLDWKRTDFFAMEQMLEDIFPFVRRLPRMEAENIADLMRKIKYLIDEKYVKSFFEPREIEDDFEKIIKKVFNKSNI